MCAVRAVLPRPINALAWFDGDVSADLDASLEASHQQQSVVDVVDRGLCEIMAVLLSDGQLLFLRSVESDLWEETLEDQVALGGPREYLLPLGYCPASADCCSSSAAGNAAADGVILASNGISQGSYLSMSSGPWTTLDETSNSNTYKAAAAEQVQQLEQQHLPIRAAAVATEAAEGPCIPLAEGRTVVGLVWLSKDKLLLLAAPYPAEEGFESGEGTVLVEVSVEIPSATAGLQKVGNCQVSPKPNTHTLQVSYAGSRVVTAATHPAGGALLQLQDSQLMYYTCSGVLVSLSSTASFPVACRKMLVLPEAPAHAAGSTAGVDSTSALQHSGTGALVNNTSSNAANSKAAQVAAIAPAVGLSDSGNLYWGQKLVASNVISIAVRGGGPGGPALLFTTRQALLIVVMVGQLPIYQHILVSAAL